MKFCGLLLSLLLCGCGASVAARTGEDVYAPRKSNETVDIYYEEPDRAYVEIARGRKKYGYDMRVLENWVVETGLGYGADGAIVADSEPGTSGVAIVRFVVWK